MILAWTKAIVLRQQEAGFGQDGLPNTQRPLENGNVEALMLGLLSGDCGRSITPNAGSLYNHAGGMFVKPELA